MLTINQIYKKNMYQINLDTKFDSNFNKIFNHPDYLQLLSLNKKNK
jgi:hypothetical protein